MQLYLDEAGVDYERRDYFGSRFTVQELSGLFGEMSISPRDALSTRSRVYRARQEEIDELDDAALIELMTVEPTLIRRPIVISGKTWTIGSRRADLEQLATTIAEG